MPVLPQVFLNSLEGIPGFERASFIEAHESGAKVTSVRNNSAKPIIDFASQTLIAHEGDHPIRWKIVNRVPWCNSGVYLASRPSFTFDPYFHAGCYYVQEASSMFLEVALQQLTDLTQNLKVLDLSAAPGGKSTHIQSLISPGSLLVSNEVIRSRSHTLRDNIIKWGSDNVIITNNDPSAFARLGSFFDVMVIDAPCSGSGLFKKDEEAIKEWSLNGVQLCSQRQKRILADALPALKENGILIYCTCSYSREEDEDIMDWLVSELDMENVPLQLGDDWNIVTAISKQTSSAGYRFFPDKVKGEGFFLATFKKKSSSHSIKRKDVKVSKTSADEIKIISKFIDTEKFDVQKKDTYLFALQSQFVPDYNFLKNELNIQYAGVGLGEIMKGKLIPHHSLALSASLKSSVPHTPVSYEEAIKYLQRKENVIAPEEMGWQTLTYGNYRLGWINALQNRINNYYPKEMRILKHHNDAAIEK